MKIILRKESRHERKKKNKKIKIKKIFKYKWKIELRKIEKNKDGGRLRANVMQANET